MKDLRFELFSQFRGPLMGIAILGVCLLHAFAWAGMGDSMMAKALGPIARIAFTEGFLFLSGFGLYYSFSRNSDIRTFYVTTQSFSKMRIALTMGIAHSDC